MTRFDLAALLADLTLTEKAALVSGSGFWHTRAVDRLGIPSIMVADGPHGLRKQPDGGDHVGAGESVPATCFPPAAGLASSWDRDLIRRVGSAIGLEALTQGVAVVLGPGINIKRSPLCGRNFEYLSEDPLLAGELGAAMVDGIQERGVGTSLKHYAVNNQETDRLRVSAQVDQRTLREIYLAGFERVVRDAAPWTVMCSYNRINGVWASQDPWLLTEVLRDQWGFDGLVMSDWGAVEDAVAAVRSGLDLEMPSSHGAGPARIVTAVEAGDLDEAVLDTAIGRLLGLIDRAVPGTEQGATFDADEHHALARQVAADCVVLLKNDHGLLPVPADVGRVAVIGEFARTPRFQGAGSSKVNPTQVDATLDALRVGLGASVQVDFAAGFGVDDPDADDAALLAQAVEVARDADRVLLFLGLPASYESEGFDRDHIDLPAEQIGVLEAVAAVNDRVVVVLANGSVVATSGWEHLAGAILESCLLGQAGGGAVADVLLGAVNPSGRLAETIPLALTDTPAYLNFPGQDREVVYGEGVFVGYRHYDAVRRDVSFPFGHGLSYTSFAYSDLVVTELEGGDPAGGWQGPARLAVQVRVTNTGKRAGKEVVQLYLAELDAPSPRPERELKGFAKVALDPAASEVVSFQLTERDLSHWSVPADRWVLRPGSFEIAIGASSRDIRVTAEVAVGGRRPALPLDRSSSLGEWLEHPVGRDLLLEAMRNAPGGDISPFVDNPEQLKVIENFPLSRLVVMMGGLLGADLIDELLAELGDQG